MTEHSRSTAFFSRRSMLSRNAPLVALLLASLASILPAGAQQARQAPQVPQATQDADEDRVPDAAPGGATYPIRMLNGAEAIRYDATKIVVYRGSATDNTGKGLIQIERSLTLDIMKVGPLGRDNVATPDDAKALASRLMRDGGAPNGYRPVSASDQNKPASGWYYPVLLGAPGAPASAILTRQGSSMRLDRPGDARPPSNYVWRRHLPLAFYYDERSGFRPMICYGWPQPFCIWTRLAAKENFRVLSSGSDAKPTEVDISDWVPGFGRIFRVQAVVTSRNGRGGAYLKTLARAEGEILAGFVNQPGDVSVQTFDLSATSQRKLTYRVDPGVELTLYAIGFSLLQPT